MGPKVVGAKVVTAQRISRVCVFDHSLPAVAAMVGAVRGVAVTKEDRVVVTVAQAVGTVARAVRAGVVPLLCTAQCR